MTELHQERLTRFERMLEAARTRVDQETVHQLRVSIRRLQAVLRQLGAPKELRAAWRPLMELAGEVRNRDIALDLAREAELPRTHPVLRQLSQERRAHAAGLRRAALDFATPSLALDGGEPADSPLGRLFRAFRKAGRRALREPSAGNLHELRLCGKRLRYALELWAPRLDRTAPARLQELKQVQDTLGAINDCVTARALTADAGFHAFLEEREQHERERFREGWRRSFGVLGARESWEWFLRRGPR